MTVLLFLAVLFQANQAPSEELLGLMLKAQYALVSGDHEQALAYAERAVAMDPQNADAAYLQVEILLELQGNSGFPQSLKAAAPLQRQKDLVAGLHELATKFKEDYRFAKALGTLLVSNPRLAGLGEHSAPEDYLNQAVILLESQAEPDIDELSDTYYYLGRWYLVSEMYFEASAAFGRVCELDQESSWALYYAAQTSEASHQLRSAQNYYLRFQGIEEEDFWRGKPPVDLDIATITAQLQPTREHIENLRDLLRDKDDLAAYYRVAARFAKAAQYELCMTVLESVPTEKREVTYYGLFLKASMELHRYGETLASVLRALEGKPDMQTRGLLVDYGVESAMLLGDFDRVRSLARTYSQTPGLTLKLDLFDAFAAVLGQQDPSRWRHVLNKHGNSDFIRLLTPQVEEMGLKIVALKNLTQLFMGRQDWNGALHGLQDLGPLEMLPDAVQEDLAVIYVLGGNPEEGFRLYADLLRKLPDRADLMNNFGYFLADSGNRLEEAKRLIETALSQDSQNSAYLDSMGWVLYHLGEFAEAERFLRLALESDGEDPEKLEHLGDVLSAMDRLPEARREWSRAMERASDAYFRILDKLDPER